MKHRRLKTLKIERLLKNIHKIYSPKEKHINFQRKIHKTSTTRKDPLASTSAPELKQLRYWLLLPLPLLTLLTRGRKEGTDGVALSASSLAKALGQPLVGKAECPTDFLRTKNLKK